MLPHVLATCLRELPDGGIYGHSSRIRTVTPTLSHMHSQIPVVSMTAFEDAFVYSIFIDFHTCYWIPTFIFVTLYSSDKQKFFCGYDCYLASQIDFFTVCRARQWMECVGLGRSPDMGVADDLNSGSVAGIG